MYPRALLPTPLSAFILPPLRFLQSPVPAPRASLAEFARAMDAVAAVPGKLAKQRLLADYFKGLAPEDLRLAVRFAAGRPFPQTDERVLAVGGAIVWDVVLALLPVAPEDLRTAAIRAGELGEALSRFWHLRARGARRVEDGEWKMEGSAGPHTPPPAALLADLSGVFDALAATGRRERKRALLLGLFDRCATGREATYLTKIIFRDLRTGVQEGLLQAAVAEAFGRPLKAVRRCQLLVGDLDAVALLAREDRLACAAFGLFHPVQFMLATPQETSDEAAKALAGRAFFAEDKLDGIRAQVHKRGDRVALYTRTMDRADEAFPEVVEAMKGLPGDFLLDGEVVPFAGGAVSPFAHLQRRLGRKAPSAEHLQRYPVTLVAFDLLYRDGDLLMDLPLRERRARLAELAARSLVPSPDRPAAPPSPGALLTTTITEVTTEAEVAAAFDAAKARGNEGLVLKDPDSAYAPGRRGEAWLKLKTHLPTLDCVVTAAEFGHGKRRNTLSDYTFAVWDRDPADPAARLVNVGKAYSGVTDAEIAQLTALFLGISTANDGHTFVVPPKVVLEIAFDQVQRSTRHASGYALRFPRIKTVRWDKRPQDADRLGRVAEIHASAANTARDTAPREGRAAKPKRPPEPTLFDHLP